jgi:prepilin-type N-terminal cleavage/methylation domain-containing protein
MNRRPGFTVVELLIVIVVIGILAAVTLVSFNGVTQRAAIAAIQSDLTNAANALELYRSTSASDVYSTTLSELGVKASSGATQTYNNNTGTRSYCVEESLSGYTYSITSFDKTIVASACIDNGLIGWWKFNGNANDSSISGVNGTITGATSITGQNGSANGAYQLGETAMYITMGNPSAYSKLGSNGFTYSVWAKRTGTSVNQWPIIMGTGNTHIYFGIRTFNFSDTIGFEYGLPPYAGASWAAPGYSSLPLNTWHLYTVSYDGSKLTAYYDGAQVAFTNNAKLYSIYGGLTFSEATNGWAGAVDDARIYNRYLSPNEVSAIYAAGAQ